MNKPVVRILFGILLCLSTLIALIFAAFRGIIFSEDYLLDKMTQGDFDKVVVESVRSNISDATTYFLPCGDTFNRTVSDEEILDYAHNSIRNIVNHMVKGTEVPKPQFESENLLKGIETDLQAFAEENDLEVEDDSVENIYESICDMARGQMMFYGKGIFEKLPSFNDYKLLINLSGVSIVVALVCFLALLLPNRKKIWSSLYTALIPVWIGTALGLIPTVMFKIYNLPERFVFKNSGMAEFIRNLNDLVVERLLLLFGAAFAIFSILVLISIIGNARHYAKSLGKKQAEDNNE